MSSNKLVEKTTVTMKNSPVYIPEVKQVPNIDQFTKRDPVPQNTAHYKGRKYVLGHLSQPFVPFVTAASFWREEASERTQTLYTDFTHALYTRNCSSHFILVESNP